MFAEQEGIEYPLLSDFWPHGEVSRAYGVFLESHGISTRGTFLIDTEGVLRWSVVNGPGEIRDADELVAAVPQLGAARRLTSPPIPTCGIGDSGVNLLHRGRAGPETCAATIRL